MIPTPLGVAYRSEPESEDNPVLNAVVRVFDRIVDATNPGLEAAQVFVGRMLLRPPQVCHVSSHSSSSDNMISDWH